MVLRRPVEGGKALRPPASLRPGKVLGGRYRLVRQLGGGGIAEVWLAYDDLGAGRAYALKVLKPSAATNREAVERSMREARLLSDLDHPHVAKGEGVFRHGERPFFTMEYLEGTTLANELGARTSQGRLFSPRLVLRVLGQLAAGADHAHRAGVIHRDLKPSNVMLVGEAKRPRVKILDFGIARLEKPDGLVQTDHGRRLGSHAYMAPEQIRGEPVTARADVFAVGAILFEMLTLRRAFIVDEQGQLAPAYVGQPDLLINSLPRIFERIERGERPQPTLYRPRLPEQIDEVVAEALAANPENRPNSCLELFEDALVALESVNDDLIPLEASTSSSSLVTLAKEELPRRPDGSKNGRLAETLPRPVNAVSQIEARNQKDEDAPTQSFEPRVPKTGEEPTDLVDPLTVVTLRVQPRRWPRNVGIAALLLALVAAALALLSQYL